MSEKKPFPCDELGCDSSFKNRKDLLKHKSKKHLKRRCNSKRVPVQGSSQSASTIKRRRRSQPPPDPDPALAPVPRSANLFRGINLKQLGVYRKCGADGWWRECVVTSNSTAWYFWHKTKKRTTKIRSVAQARSEGIKIRHLFDGTKISDKKQGMMQFVRLKSDTRNSLSDQNNSANTNLLPTAIQPSQPTINDLINLIQQNNWPVEAAINLLEAHFKKKKRNELCSRLEKVAHTRHHNKKEADKLLEGLEVEGNQKQQISLLKRGRQLSSIADGKTDIATLDFAQIKQYVNKHDNIARIVKLEETCSNDVDALRLAVRTALQELSDRKMCSITASKLEEDLFDSSNSLQDVRKKLLYFLKKAPIREL